MGSIGHRYTCIVLYMKVIWCNGFKRFMLNWRRGWNSGIYETYLVYWFSRYLCLIGGEGGLNLPFIYMHLLYIYKTDLV